MVYDNPIFEYNGNKRKLIFNHYVVNENSNNYSGVYRNNKLITSRTTFKSACKVDKLLEHAYIEGFNDGKDWL